ncbi:MAG: DEAD/DEAH box helicase, partial [Deltaproteobacteria bacterium]|nr:DEAD/DEAH box helicase [Deltaproteobacteria bacterium]
CTVVYGGIGIHPQITRLKRGVDILVATPGRLLDLAARRRLDLSLIEFLVFDEADRMLDLGFSGEISAILDLLPTERRTMLFSATYTRQIRDLAARMLQDPEYIEVTPENTAAESVIQKVHLVDRSNKRALLIHLITRGDWRRVLVFARTKHGTNKLTEKLVASGVGAVAMHGNKSQSFRTRTLKAFKNGEIRILVATDVAARGLDISNLPYVVNYDMPTSPEDYVHRIGRTGRAGESGIAISLVSQDEKPHLKAIEKLLGQKLSVEMVDGYTEESDVPDYVLYRPNSVLSEKKADKAIKALVAKRNVLKQRSKSRSGGRNGKTVKKPSRKGSHFPQSSKKGKSRHKR